MDQSKKRERATNFEISEVRLLTELVTKYRSVLENKKIDTVSNKEKEGAWNKIATAFNATSSVAVVRTAKTLKIKYETLKKSTRKKMTLHRQLYKTGGRPSTAPDINSVDEKVLETCSNISGLDASNESDNIADVQPEECPVVLPVLSANIILFEDAIVEETTDFNVNQDSQSAESFLLNNGNDEDEIEDLLNGGAWNPKSLKSKVSQVLKPNNISETDKLDQLRAAQLELVQLQIEIAKKEHSFVEEEHKRKMLYLQCDEVRKEELHQLMLNKSSKNADY